MIEELFEKFDGAFAPNTIRAYKSDYTDFSQWCQANKVNQYQACGVDIASYITHLAKTKKSATIRRRVDSLSSIYKLSGLNNPCSKPEATLALKRIYRSKGRHQQQATPLTEDILKKLLRSCTNDTRGLRDQVLLKLGYETMRRRAEICEFKFSDIKTNVNGKKAILLRYSKADQYGQGKLILISDDLYKTLIRWKRTVKDENYILRGVGKSGNITKSLSPSSLSRRLKELQGIARLSLENELSGHSFRVGGAFDLMSKGYSFEKIMLKGGWRSESTVMQYLRTWNEL